MYNLFNTILNVITYVITSPYHVGKSIYNQYKYNNKNSINVTQEEVNQNKNTYDAMAKIINENQNNKELIKLITYKALAVIPVIDWNYNETHVVYHEIIQSLTKTRIEYLQNMVCIAFDDKRLQLITVYKAKIHTLQYELLPRIELVIQDKLNNNTAQLTSTL
jgi:hypothetical protein